MDRCVTCSPTGPHAKKGALLALRPCGSHLEALNNFIFAFMVCK